MREQFRQGLTITSSARRSRDARWKVEIETETILD